MKIVKQWKTDTQGRTTEDKSCIVIDLQFKKNPKAHIVIHKRPFHIKYFSFVGGA